MSIWLRLANRLILEDSRDPIDPEQRRRETIELPTGLMEAWVFDSNKARNGAPNLFALKFPGAGGRAERGGSHPCEVLSPNDHQVWTINPPGYGGSEGTASVKNMPHVSSGSWKAIAESAGDAPTIVCSSSLGGVYAMYVAAEFPVAGVFMRNPPPLHQMIRGRYSWWNFGLLTGKVVDQIPSEMDVIANAKKATAPLFMVTCDDDRIVPPKYQQMICDAYGGPITKFEIAGGRHHTPVPEEQAQDYCRAIAEWGKTVLGDC